jgi:ATP synthase F1 complex assembly factor 2
MERATYTTKSFIVALSLVKRQLTADQAAETAQVEVNSQIERWGEVEDCECPPKEQRLCGFLRDHSSDPLSVDSPSVSSSNLSSIPAHDVDYYDIRRQLGSAACLLSNI